MLQKIQTHICFDCKTTISLPMNALTRSFVCPGCFNYFEFTTQRVTYQKKLEFGHTKPVFQPGIDITLRGIVYRVLGFAERQIANDSFTWMEYHLWNDIEGACFLSESNGGWIFLKREKKSPKFFVENVNVAYLDGVLFEIYSHDSSELLSARGTFLHKIDGATVYREYIAPPLMISKELSLDYMAWYRGEYVAKSEVLESTTEAIELPAEVGFPILKPNPVRMTNTHLVITFAAYIGVLLLVLLFSTFAGRQEVLEWDMDIPRYVNTEKPNPFSSTTSTAHKDTTLVSPSFEVKGIGNLGLSYSASIENSWMFVDASLINESTGEEFYFSKDIQYYSGIDDGYQWSEGDKKPSQTLSRIPSGKYRLQMKVDQALDYKSKDLRVYVVRNDPPGSNFFFFAIIGALLLFVLYLLRGFFEMRRWSNSDFGQYAE
jgi:hypothetical protein